MVEEKGFSNKLEANAVEENGHNIVDLKRKRFFTIYGFGLSRYCVNAEGFNSFSIGIQDIISLAYRYICFMGFHGTQHFFKHS